MKKLKTFSLIAISTLLLTACSDFRYVFDSYEKKITVYNLDTLVGNDIESANEGKIKARFIKNQDYIPYLSLESYASLYESHFASGIRSAVKTSPSSVSWTIESNGEMIFFSSFFFSSKQVLVAGSLESALKAGDDPVDRRALYYGARSEYDSKVIGKSAYAIYSFNDCDVTYFKYFNDYYLPLGLLDLTYSNDATVYFTYNYDSIYSAHDVDSFAGVKFQKNNKEMTVNSEMYASKKDEQMPTYLKEYNANLFLYVLDNFYGLKEYKGINSAREYTKNIGTYDNLFSTDDKQRVQAYADSLSYLDDNHTALVSANDTWGEQSFIRWKYGEGCVQRTLLRQTLVNKREQTTSKDYQSGDEILYSASGKTAMAILEGFTFGTSEQVFTDDNKIKDEAYRYDSFIYLKQVFETLANNDDVENVIIDITTNGGGVLGVMMKLLALISKDNSSDFYYLEGSSNILGSAKTKVNCNDDSYFDDRDCYGDDFNIYILTSDCSFSCANAFPCIAQISGFAQIIGQKSGGGECAVGIHYLPNSEYVYHSSTLHLGNYDEETNVFTGFEDGAKPDIEITNLDEFYNIDKLAEYIEK